MHIVRFRRFSRTIGWVHSSLSNYGLDDGCPLELGARKSHKVFIPEAVLSNVLSEGVRKELRAVVQGELWNSTHSSIFKVDWKFAP